MPGAGRFTDRITITRDGVVSEDHNGRVTNTVTVMTRPASVMPRSSSEVKYAGAETEKSGYTFEIADIITPVKASDTLIWHHPQGDVAMDITGLPLPRGARRTRFIEAEARENGTA